MHLKITHLTRYDFDAPVPYGLQHLRLTPSTSGNQDVLSWSIGIEGGKRELGFVDFHGNTVELVSLDSDTRSLSIRCEGEVELRNTNGVLGPHREITPLWLFLRETPLTTIGKGVRDMCRKLDGEGELAQLHELSDRILERIPYQIGKTTPEDGAEAVIEAGHGVCQDHAHVFIACARHMGIPARYVSGYLLVDDQPNQEATHAWAEAHVDGLGWVGFDVSNGVCPDDRYVRVATGLDYAEAAPMSGTRMGPSGQTLKVNVEVSVQDPDLQAQQQQQNQP
jgi:transglutaminase-like putative cysteine protease